MLNLYQLHVFLIVNEMGSFSAAATRLHMTQPGVSQQIRALENHLNTRLFIRRGHGVELTPAGADLVEPARRLTTLAENTELSVMRRRGEISGRIRIGTALLSGTYTFTSWIHDFRTQYPDVGVQMESAEPGPLLGALRAQDLDAGLVLGRLRGRGLLHHKVDEDPVVLVVPLNHPWTWPQAEPPQERDGPESDEPPADTAGGGVTPAALADCPLVLEHSVGESHSDSRRALADALDLLGLKARDLRIALEVPGPMSVACAVAEGVGAGFVPASVARRFIGQVVPVRLDGFDLVQHIYLIRDRKALHSPAVQAWWRWVGARTGQRASAGRAAQEAALQPQRLPSLDAAELSKV